MLHFPCLFAQRRISVEHWSKIQAKVSPEIISLKEVLSVCKSVGFSWYVAQRCRAE